jgi:hypothetical protein
MKRILLLALLCVAAPPRGICPRRAPRRHRLRHARSPTAQSHGHGVHQRRKRPALHAAGDGVHEREFDDDRRKSPARRRRWAGEYRRGVDADGNYGFWAPPGRYVLTVSGTGVQTPITMTVTLPCDSTVTSCALGGQTVHGETLVSVPPKIERALRAFARAHPEDAHFIEQSLKFRSRVLQEFERLVRKVSGSGDV